MRQGVTLPEMSVLDVAPTLAYLLGVPIADDLPGRFAEEAMEPLVLEAIPPRRTATWDSALPFD